MLNPSYGIGNINCGVLTLSGCEPENNIFMEVENITRKAEIRQLEKLKWIIITSENE